jgi:hypothetical protein
MTPRATSSAKHQREPFIYLIEPIDPAGQIIGIDFYARSRSANIGKSIVGRTER